MKKVYDEFMAWPYHEPYGMVAAPKAPKVRKKRKSRAMPEWLKQQRKLERTQHGKTRKRRPPKDKHVEQAPAAIRSTPLLEAAPQGFAETFTRGALT